MKLQQSDFLRIKEHLNKLLQDSESLRCHAREKDPVGVLYRYTYKSDIEIAGFVASTLSYGKQSVFRPVIDKILDIMGNRPSDFVLYSKPIEWFDTFSWLNYRFTKGTDLACLLLALRHMYKSGQTLQSVFLEEFLLTGSIKTSAQKLIESLYLNDYCEVYSNQQSIFAPPTNGFSYLIPQPKDGSACKRLNMFLRWMIRKDDIDLGLWTGIPKSTLVIPLDTHVARISKRIGLTTKAGGTWKVAEDITDSLRYLDPEDPLKFDFPLCTAGILGAL